MRNRRTLFILSMLVAGSPASFAQQAAAGDDMSELLALLNTPVVSASKSEQSIGQAPAKIVAITAEDIRRRGYQDLEEIFHDLAGMDFAFGRGVEWSTIFMRGMRTDNTDHFLMIWDGVIQNDTWKYNVWISRQYPLLNIERIEVMYGPSSLLYGANAFGGIVNVILKKPKDVNGVAVQANGGSFRTKMVEVNFGKESGDWRFSANARSFRSDEMDMNGKSWVDNAGRRRYYNLVYNPAAAPGERNDFSTSFPAAQVVNGVPQWVVGGQLQPLPLRAYGDTKDWWIQAGVGYGDFELRAYFWSRQEMEDSWYTPIRRMHGPWTPTGSAIYLTHDKKLGESLSMKSYLRTVTSGLDPDLSYDGGFGRRIRDLTDPEDLKVRNTFSVDNTVVNGSPLGVPSFLYYKLSNREWRAGQQFNFGVPRVNSVFGWEYVSSRNYEDYNTRGTTTGTWGYPAAVPNARYVSNAWIYTPQHDERNFAAFANAQVDPAPILSLAAGFRYDYNYLAGEKGGFGHLYTGRLAGILTPNDQHRFKVIYGQAFQAPSPWQKFSTVPGDRAAGGALLKPERLASTELIWEFAPVQKWRNSLSLYYNQITDQILLGSRDAVTGLNKQENKGGLRIFGQELESRYFFDAKNSVYFNATSNRSKIPDTGINQGGLANTKANLGADLLFRGAWSLNLRGHYMSNRDVTQLVGPPNRPASLLPNGLVGSAAQTAEAYFTADAVLTWLGVVKGLDVRMAVYNLFDKEYFDPGTRVPDGRGNNSLIVQQPRRAFLGVAYKF